MIRSLSPTFYRTIAAVVIIGCLVIVAGCPTYQVQPEQSPWGEGKANAGLIQAALKVLKAENSGKLTPYTGGIGPVDYVVLDLEATEFDGANFMRGDYRLTAIDKEAGTWTIAVTSSVPNGPTGTYFLNSAGEATDP